MEFFEIFPWDKNFETGIDQIDEQHKQLVNILNQLAAHLANCAEPVVLNDIFDELAAYADYHFKTEEEIWAKYLKEDEWFTSHEKTHKTFIDDVVLLKSNNSEKKLDDRIQDVVSFLSRWLAYHILDTDKRMALTIIEIQSGISIEEAKIHSNAIMSGSMRVLIDTVLKMYDNLSLRTLDLMREKSLRKKAEEELSKSEDRWRFILETGSDSVWDWDIEKNQIFNSENENISFEIVANKFHYKDNISRIHPADRTRLTQQIQDHLDGKTKFYVSKYRILRDNGSWSWILSSGKVTSFDKQGNASRMVGTNADITERELASLIFLHSNQAIFITDIKNNIISVNPTFTKITGYSEQESIGMNPSFLGLGENNKAFFENIWGNINPTDYLTIEVLNKRKNGEQYSGLLNFKSVFNPEGNIDHNIVLFSDITEMKNADESIIQKTKELEETNTALRVIVAQQKKLQENFQQDILSQMHKSIFPYIDLLKHELKDEHYKEYLSIIMEHLQSIGTSFNKRLENPGFGLTKKELLVADLVRQGKSTKQIAPLLNLEARSVEAYRNKIRKKLKINNKKISLIEYLKNFSEKN